MYMQLPQQIPDVTVGRAANVTRYEQRPTESDEFSLGFFTLIAGIRF